MANELQQTLNNILEDKNTNLKPENLKAGITCLGINGTMQSGIDTSDATATSGDILLGKTAYVNGEKITGTISDYTPIDWSNNNFELKNGKLLIKNAFATIGFNGKTDLTNVWELPIPLELEAVIKSNKDNLIMWYYMDRYNNSSYLYIYVPKESHKIMAACTNAAYDIERLDAPIDITLATLDDYTYFFDVDENGNCYDSSNFPDNKYTEYRISYTSPTEKDTVPNVSSTSSSTDYYDSIINLYEDNTYYKAFMCLGTQNLIDNMNNIDELFKLLDWSSKNDTLFGTTVTDIETTFDTVELSNEFVNNTSSVDVTLTEEQTNTWNMMDGTIIYINNPNGSTSKSLSDYSILFRPFIRKIKIDDENYGILGFNGFVSVDIDTYISIWQIYDYTGSPVYSSYGYNSAGLFPTFYMTSLDGGWEHLPDKSVESNNWDGDYIGYYRKMKKDVSAAQFKIDTDVYLQNQYMPY